MMRTLSRRLLPAATLAALCAAVLAIANAENIDPQNDNSQFAWGENVGWINAEPGGNGQSGMQVSGTKITGFMWGENIGWINLHCENNNTCGTAQYGVTNDGFGRLGGFAWGENVGWISFCDQDTPGTCNPSPTYQVVIDPATGLFSGYAWGENIGWISFSDTDPVAYGVKFDDNDGVAPAQDNCDFDSNPAPQTNTDAAPIVTTGAPNDNTVPNGDGFGDVCDEDDDNDLILDVNEAAGCNGGTALDPLNGDTDGDRVRDGAECLMGTNPKDANSKPPQFPAPDGDFDGLSDGQEGAFGSNPGDADTDDDGIPDGLEARGYSTQPFHKNTDGDVGFIPAACDDNIEITSVDGNTTVNSIDLAIIANQFGQTTRPNPDINKNGIVNAQDLGIVAQNFGKTC